MTAHRLSRRVLLAGVATAVLATPAAAQIEGAPAPFDEDGVRIALVRQLSNGDFFQAYLSGAERQAEALNVELRVFDAAGDAALQATMMEQAIALGVDGIVVQHGLTENMAAGVARAREAGIPVVAFDVNVNNPEVPQIEQSDHLLARMVMEQAIADHGDAFDAGYVYVAGFAPLDRRDEVWREFKDTYPGINEVAQWGVVNDTVANSVADQAAAVLRANPEITVVVAPYDEFARGTMIAVNEAGLGDQIDIYSADVSTANIQQMREEGSPWVATAATNPAVVGEVSVRALAMLMAGEDPGAQVVVPPALVTQDMLRELDIQNMADLSARVPSFAHADVAMTDWMPLPQR